MSPTCLTIAGSDPSGGAGVQADLKTFAIFGVRGLSALTAITSQTNERVIGVYPIPADVLTQQLSSVVAEGSADAVKIGMIGTNANVRAVAWFLSSIAAPHVVVDTVFSSTSGAELLEPSGRRPFKEILLPLATLVTPNMEEAGVLTGMRVWNHGTMREAARQIYDEAWQLRRDRTRPLAVLVKGGHIEGDAIDILYNGRDFKEFHGKRIAGTRHGTGCVLSSAIAADLAIGKNLELSIEEAKRFTEEYLKQAPCKPS